MPPQLPLPNALAQLLPPKPPDDANLGLWLDRFLPRDAKDNWSFTGEQRLDALRPFARAWTAPVAAEVLARRAEGCRVLGLRGEPVGEGRDLLLRFRARLASKLLLDHGRATATELSVSVHAQWGAPRLAGSGLKGLCRSEATLAEWATDEIEALFGRGGDDEARAGALCFFDALPEGGRFSLSLDTITPHHQRWNGGDEDALPVDWESPVPVSFLAIANATFVIDVGARGNPEDRVADRAAQAGLRRVGALLGEALALPGFGGKTAAGYGSFEVV